MENLKIKDGRVNAMLLTDNQYSVVSLQVSFVNEVMGKEEKKPSAIKNYVRYGDWFFEIEKPRKVAKKNG